MIQKVPISRQEAIRLRQNSVANYWALPLGFSFLFVAITWIFSFDWELLWWLLGGLWSIFVVLWLLWGASISQKEITHKFIRRGTVVHAEYKGNHAILSINIGQYVQITLDAEPGSDRQVFRIWQTGGMPYFTQDNTLRRRHAELIGKEVEIEYLPGGEVLAFRES